MVTSFFIYQADKNSYRVNSDKAVIKPIGFLIEFNAIFCRVYNFKLYIDNIVTRDVFLCFYFTQENAMRPVVRTLLEYYLRLSRPIFYRTLTRLFRSAASSFNLLAERIYLVCEYS